MKRENLNGKLCCKKCNFLGEPEEFKEVQIDVDLCPLCGEDHLIKASTIEWCERCEEKPQKKGSALCVDCGKEVEKELEDSDEDMCVSP